MSFQLGDIIVESILRDGLENARRDEAVIDDVFGSLTRAYASKKYGDLEIAKIKKLIQSKQIAIVHSFNLVNANIPCISIQLADDIEDTDKAVMGDHMTFATTMFKTPEQIASTYFVDSFTPMSYDVNTGIVKVPNTVDLSNVYSNLLFRDAASVDHVIIGGIINDMGAKQFMVASGSAVIVGPSCSIRTSINYTLNEVKGHIETIKIVIGVHAQDALLTKYLYTLVKYFVLSRKADMTRRGLQLSTYSGSDFTRNMAYQADTVFTRFFQFTGIIQNSWLSDKVQLIDSVDVNILVEKDIYGNEVLGIEDQTVKMRD